MEQTEEKTTTDETKTETSASDKPAEETKETWEKKKKSTKSTDLTVDKKQVDNRSAEELNLLVEIENELQSQVKLEKERCDSKNAVEEYVYSMREKMYDTYEQYITEQQREQFAQLLSQTEDWLYEDGEDETKSVYVDKLAELKKVGNPVVDRFNSHKALPPALEELGTSLLHYRKVLDLYSQKDEKYDHLEADEMKKVEKKVDEKFKWYNEKLQLKASCPLHNNPPVFPSEVQAEKRLLETFCNPIVNKSKPKPKEEPPKDVPKENTAPKDDTTNTTTTDNGEPVVNGNHAEGPPAEKEGKMDVDQQNEGGVQSPGVDLTM